MKKIIITGGATRIGAAIAKKLSGPNIEILIHYNKSKSKADSLKRELEKIGIRIQIDLMPTSSLRQAKTSGKLELFRASWIADYPDAENYLGLFYSKNFSPNGPNYTHYSNTQYDKWFEESYLIKDPKKRAKHYRKMNRLMLSDYPVIPPVSYTHLTLPTKA